MHALCVCVCVCARARACACVGAYVRACVRALVRMYLDFLTLTHNSSTMDEADIIRLVDWFLIFTDQSTEEIAMSAKYNSRSH